MTKRGESYESRPLEDGPLFPYGEQGNPTWHVDSLSGRFFAGKFLQ